MQLNLSDETLNNVLFAIEDAIRWQLERGIDTHNYREAHDILNEYIKSKHGQPKGDTGSDYDYR